MECDPTLSEDVAQLARPWLRVRLLQLVIARALLSGAVASL